MRLFLNKNKLFITPFFAIASYFLSLPFLLFLPFCYRFIFTIFLFLANAPFYAITLERKWEVVCTPPNELPIWGEGNTPPPKKKTITSTNPSTPGVTTIPP